MIKRLIFLMLVISSFKVQAQTKAIELGDVYYDYFQYDEAIKNYEQALLSAKPADMPYLYRQIAYCHQYSFRYIKAEEFYTKLIQDNIDLTPEDHLDFGKMLKLNGKYEQAKEQFQKFNELKKNASSLATIHINSIDWAMKNKDVVKPAQIYVTDLNINGQCLGYALFEGGMIYARSDTKKPVGTMPIFDLDYALISDSIHFTAGDPILKQIDFEANEGAPSINRMGSLLYFNANATKLKNGKVRKVGGTEISEESVSNFKIYVSLNQENQFVKIQELPFNDNKYNCVHPAISDDGNTLYFASDMPGGYGGLDLYMVRRNSEGTWGSPVNLGTTVNTAENELFPFIYKDRIYFSSKGLNGYGGYDIYTAKVALSGIPASPQNMGKPFNSHRDDLAYITYENGRYGYFSSNRENNEGKDQVYFFHDLTFDPIPEAPVTEIRKDTLQAPVASEPKPQITKAPVVTPVPTPTPTPAPKPVAPVTKQAPPIVKQATPAIITPSAPTVQQPQRSRQEIEELYLAKKFNHGHFMLNSINFDEAYQTTLDTLVKAYKLIPTLRIEISGHADARGPSAYNQTLSLRRAKKIKSFLVSHGVPSGKVIVRGYGETQLLNQCSDGVDCSDQEHAINRRVEIKMIR
jgi:outer membrane protein OmpA-like peptidoglycan-associated protein/tetratricopeptide (TPR) repeat protein